MRPCRLCKKPFRRIQHELVQYCRKCSDHLLGLQGRDLHREKRRILDNHRCRTCHKKWLRPMRRFDVHHLNGVCGKKSRGYDAHADLKNLITLCHKCHYKVHSKNTLSKNKLGRKVFSRQRACKLRASGLTYSQIAKQFNVSYAAVAKAVPAHLLAAKDTVI